MGKSSLFLLAVTLAIFGAAVLAGYPPWGTVTGGAILLVAAGVAAGAIPTQSEGYTVERRQANQKISNGLVTLSSAAILAVYAAGYQRTRAAEDEFEAQIARRKAPAPLVAAAPAVEALPALPDSPAPPPRKARPRSAPAEVPKAAPKTVPQGAPAESPAAAPAPPAATPAPPVAAPAVQPRSQYRDGTYLGWGTSRHGDIQASVEIASGRITSAAIVQCLTRYSCSWISPRTPGTGSPEFDLPGQVVTRQSAKVDYVSGATESSDAFFQAISQALSKASE
jgi:uncharacterized protein with FMN-binding domain